MVWKVGGKVDIHFKIYVIKIAYIKSLKKRLCGVIVDYRDNCIQILYIIHIHFYTVLNTA